MQSGLTATNNTFDTLRTLRLCLSVFQEHPPSCSKVFSVESRFTPKSAVQSVFVATLHNVESVVGGLFLEEKH